MVTLNRDDTHGAEARFVLEMKNRPLNMRKTMAELDEALVQPRRARRRSRCSARRSRRPPSVPFQYFDDKAIVVLDPDDEDESALRLAYMWARWTVRKGLAVSEEAEVDLERVRCLLDDAARALERHTSIKRFHTQARRASTRPPTRCATWSARCTRASRPSTPSSAPEPAPAERRAAGVATRDVVAAEAVAGAAGDLGRARR